MSTESDAEWTDRARAFSKNHLGNIKATLGGTHINLGLLFGDMRDTLHWAVEHWLRRRGDTAGGSWTDQEARFLRNAPPDQRDDYLELAGGVTRLADNLLDQLDAPGIRMIAIAAPSLAPWRETLAGWIADAETLVGRLLDPEPLVGQPGSKRICRGALRGRLDGLMPSLLLVRAGGGFGRWLRGGETPGLFDLGAADAKSQYVSVHKGLILPLALCRDPELQCKLADFAEMLRAPAGRGRTADAFGRRLALQSWLDREGLGFLHLADKEFCQCWTRFILTRAVFARLLSRFDFVTALLDGAGQPCRILEQAPFRWTSQGDFLDWCLTLDTDRPIIPFHLYFAGEAMGCTDPFASSREKKQLVRPLSYWASCTRPGPDAICVPVSVRFNQEESDYGWIDFEIGLGQQRALLTLSDVYDPFPTLLEWLDAVSEGDLPIAIDIDEEGPVVRLLAHRLDERRLLVAVLDRYPEAERAAAVVDRDAFLEACRVELRRFLGHHLNTDRWGRDWDDDEPSTYRESLLGHPFIA